MEENLERWRKEGFTKWWLEQMLYGKTSSFEVRALGQMQFNHIAKLSICDSPFPSLLMTLLLSQLPAPGRVPRQLFRGWGRRPFRCSRSPPAALLLGEYIWLQGGSAFGPAPSALRDIDSRGPGTSVSFSPSSFPGSSHTPQLVTLHKL